jgi:hypothetical protein
MSETPDLTGVERDYRAGQISHREIGRQHGRSESWVRKLAKRKGWARDLAGAVRHQVRESLVREGSRQSELIGIKPSDAAIIDEAAAIGVAVVRSHRLDINALRQAAAGLLDDLGLRGPRQEWQLSGAQGPFLLKVTDRSRVIADLSAAMARLVPLERQAFGLDEPGQGEEKTYEERLRALCAAA